jgi:hypothetical protein
MRYPITALPPLVDGVPQLIKSALRTERVVVTVADVGALGTPTGIADVNAPAEVATPDTAETRNQYEIALLRPVTRNEVLFGSDNDDTTLSPLKEEFVPYSTLYPMIGLPPLFVGAVQFNIT